MDLALEQEAKASLVKTSPQTFLFTDLEDSTHLWDQAPEAMRGAMACHDKILREAIKNQGGRIVKTTGDGVHAVFDSAVDAIGAALSGQLALSEDVWPSETGPLKVRMGLHTGESQERDGDYYGPAVNEAARIMGVGHGGQVLLSETTALLARGQLADDITFIDLGPHRLKGVAQPEVLYQLCHPELVVEFPPIKSLSVLKHNLHIQPTSFVGREREMDSLIAYLKDTHLLTLLGPGGTGKTRLMLQVAEEVIEDYPDGVWLVELAPVADPNLTVDRVAAALNVQEQPGRQILDTLTDYLRRKELLLLLDNVEHLIREAAALAEHLLANCPEIKILVTGREALFIGGETTMQIPSLALPQVNNGLTPEEIGEFEGVRLFLERGRSVQPDFSLTQANAASIAEIVQRLDGIPLAIELAAARMRMLSVEQIADRLNDRFRLLTGGRRTALPRQQTLQALIDWSWNLLEESERILLRRLSVFSGGWRLRAAQAVAGTDPLDEYDVFDNLEQLINKSLVVVEQPDEGDTRYRMLESIRQYAQEKLFEAGEGEKLRDRHAEYYMQFAEEAAPHLVRSDMMPWLNRLKLENDNFRSVLSWTLEDRPEIALRICAALFFIERNIMTPREAHAWLVPAINNMRPLLGEEETGIRRSAMIQALIGLATNFALLGRNKDGLMPVEEGIELARQFGKERLFVYGISMKVTLKRYITDPHLIEEANEAVAISRQNQYDVELVLALGAAASAHLYNGDLNTALTFVPELKSIADKINNPHINVTVLWGLAGIAALTGDMAEAKVLYRRSTENAKIIGSRWLTAAGQSNLAHIYRNEGDFEKAEAIYRETILAWQEQGHQSAVCHQLECFAYVSIDRDDLLKAAKLLGAAAAGRQRLNEARVDPREIAEFEAASAQLVKGIGEAEMERLMAEGGGMDLDEAVSFALAKDEE